MHFAADDIVTVDIKEDNGDGSLNARLHLTNRYQSHPGTGTPEWCL